MFRHLACCFSFALAFCACSTTELPYNSNSGTDGARDTATQLLLDAPKVDSCNAETRDNEDWYYLVVDEDGKLTTTFFFDKPNQVEGKVYFRDGFGRSLQSLHITPQNGGMIEFTPTDVTKGKYFFNTACLKGKSSYTIKASLELPPPPAPEIVVKEPEPETQSQPKKVRTRTKSAPKTTHTEDVFNLPQGAKLVTGVIILVTPGEDGISRITIRGVGSKNGVDKTSVGRVKGLNRKVTLYSCERTKCQGTIKATPEDLSTYDKVEFVGK